MSWLKQSDASANHPITLRALEHDDADDRILNEVYGFVNRCATQAAAHDQDYIVTVGTAKTMAGSLGRYHELVKIAKYCGYFTEVMVEVDGEQRKAFKLVEDNDLFHMILKAEKDWAAQRKRDTRNPGLTVPVRHRDGDACRYCGKVVSWTDRVSGRAGSYDHLVAGEGATTPEEMVVCCKECNGKRQNDPESSWKLLPLPAEPFYGPATVAFLAKHDVAVTPSYTRTPFTPAPAPANGTQAAEEPRAVEQPTEATPAKDEATAPSGLSSDSAAAPGGGAEHAATDSPAADLPDLPSPDLGQRSPGPSPVGSGRDGTGSDGSGSDVPGQAGAGAQLTPPGGKPRKRRNRPRKRR